MPDKLGLVVCSFNFGNAYRSFNRVGGGKETRVLVV